MSREAMCETVSRTLAMASLELCASLRICSLNVVERSDRLRTSSATTAKPRPASPARAASMAAFSASRLVWSAIDFTSSSSAKMPSRCWAIWSICCTVVLLWPLTCSSASTSCSMRWLACWAKRATSTPAPPSSPARSTMRARAWLCWRDLRFIASKLLPRPPTAWRIRSRARSTSPREPSISLPTNWRSSVSSWSCSRRMRACSGERCAWARVVHQAKPSQLSVIVVRIAQRSAAGQSRPMARGSRRVRTRGAARRMKMREYMDVLGRCTVNVSAVPPGALAALHKLPRVNADGGPQPRPWPCARAGSPSTGHRSAATAPPSAPPPATGHGSRR